MFRWNPREHLNLGVFVLKWTLLAAPMAAAVGSACALFLWALQKATEFRFAHPWLLLLLPVAGVAIVAVYQKVGGKAEGGNNLLMEEIHEPGGGVPRRMAPLILVATVTTHLFGGSAGREGTAVQMGGSIASFFGRLLGLTRTDMRLLLMCGIAAGFGGVFGTPLAGAVFAMEVLVVGRMSYEALIPCLIASIVGDWGCAVWGIRHTHYTINPEVTPHLTGGLPYDPGLMGKVVLASIAFGLVSVLFAELTHGLNHFWKKIPHPLLRPVAGALCVIALTYALGTQDYLGLGVTSASPHAVTLLSCFQPGGANALSWWWKLLFTALTLSCGFKGGEVTPLFFIGAALGNALSGVLGAPVDLFAGLGFIAVFAGATNTPLACTIMGVELFGSYYTVYFMVACYLAYGFSGHSGIYASQRIGTPKIETPELPPNAPLRLARELKPDWRMSLERILKTDFKENQNLNGSGHSVLSIEIEDEVSSNELNSDEENSFEGMSTNMSNHHVTSREVGQIRIYMTPGERSTSSGGRLKRLLSSNPLYVEIIQAAKQAGMMSATAHHTHYGFSGNSAVHGTHAEVSNPALTLMVEITGERGQLEQFCRKHASLLQGKIITYKHMEHWELNARTLRENEATPEEYEVEDEVENEAEQGR